MDCFTCSAKPVGSPAADWFILLAPYTAMLVNRSYQGSVDHPAL
jgi:hypothetical protein